MLRIQRDGVELGSTYTRQQKEKIISPPFLFPSSNTTEFHQIAHPITPNTKENSELSSEAKEEDTFDAAVLLTTMRRSVVPKEDGCLLERRVSLQPELDFCSSPSLKEPPAVRFDSPPSLPHISSPSQSDDFETHFEFNLSRKRTVSMDLSRMFPSQDAPENLDVTQVVREQRNSPPIVFQKVEGIGASKHHAFVSPPASPVISPHRIVDRRKRYMADKENTAMNTEETTPSSHDCNQTIKMESRELKQKPEKRPQVKKILRKKFSWKNYPVLETFLIANREEYLRHSALNYTMQQKQYNNRLTERLIELAQEHGYIFDEEAFSFVTVRDRIRCYFKSYVQSRKKRGHIIGYAARKAGLLSEEELEKIAGKRGKIIIPK